MNGNPAFPHAIDLAVAAPTRLVARHVSEMLSDRHRRWKDLLGTDPLTAFIMGVVIGAGMQHHPYRAPGGGRWIPIEAGATLGRAVSGSAVAQSMHVPLTTVRRHAADLIAAGLLERRPGGFVAAPAFFRDPRVPAFACDGVATLARMLEALAAAGYAPARRWPREVLDVVPAGVVERLLLTFALRALETFTTQYDGFQSGLIVAMIVEMNVRPVTRDSLLSARYADVPPPDALRVPVSIRALAQALDLPFETARRRVAMLMQAGTVVRSARGVIVPASVLSSDLYAANNRRMMAHFEHLLHQLSALARPTSRAA